MEKCENCELQRILKTDGHELAGSVMDYLADAVVSIADGATSSEWHKITENLEIYITIKKRGQK